MKSQQRTGSLEMGAKGREIPHPVPCCLLTLYDKANDTELVGEGIQAWIEWEMEAMRWRVPVEISRADLEELVEASAGYLERCMPDRRRWGSRGGKETVRRYGTEWMALLALRRWGRITSEDLQAARPLR